MKRKPAAPVFKPYVMGQPYLLPPKYDHLIEPGHLVRVVSEVIDRLDLSPLLVQDKGGSTLGYQMFFTRVSFPTESCLKEKTSLFGQPLFSAAQNGPF